MSDALQQIAALSPEEKRALLTQFLQKRAERAPSVYPLSYNQQSAWFLYQLAPTENAYQLMYAWTSRPALDAAALQRALLALVGRHAGLRTTYAIREGAPVQLVHKQPTLQFEVHESASWSRDQLDQYLVEEAHRPFDLQQEPPLRIHLFVRSPQESILLLTLHHIAIDGWSFVVLLDELGVLYTAEQAGAAVSLPPLPAVYTDYVRWQQAILAEPEGEQLWAYWQQQLAGELPILDLPTDRPRPASQTYRGASCAFHVNQELSQRLKELAKDEGITLYAVLLAAFFVLLSRYTGQDDILVGSPTSGRNRPEFAGIVGYLANTVVLRADLSADTSVRTFLGQVYRTVLGALDHQDYPFPLLVKRLKPDRGPSRSPLVDVMFVLQKSQRFGLVRAADGAGLEGVSPLGIASAGEAGMAIDFGAATLTSYPVAQRIARVDLDLMLIEAGGSISGVFQYNTDLFDAPTLARLAEHFQTLLAGMVAAPGRRLNELPMLGPAERRSLAAWNATGCALAGDSLVHHLFETWAVRTPEAVACVVQHQQLTYQELDRRSNQLAHSLQQLGVGPEVLVGICLERSPELVVAVLGILKAGGGYLPLDPAYPPERLAFMLEDARVALLVTQESLLAALPARDAPIVCLDSGWSTIAQQPTRPAAGAVVADNPAYVIYTSGSTGRPKGVLVPHRGLCNVAEAQLRMFDLRPGDRVLQFASLSFDASIFEMLMALGVGATLCLGSREALLPGTNLLQFLRDMAITIVTLPPTALAVMPMEQLPNLRVVTVAGEACPDELAARWELGRQFFNLYGPTETTIWATAARYSADDPALTIGRPIANTQVYLLDDHLQPVPVRVAGQIYIGGAGVARGYLGRPDLTAERFIPNPFATEDGGWRMEDGDSPSSILHPPSSTRLYRTGDLARYRADGSIEYLGRIDHQVKLRGLRIELGEIEAHLVRHPAVREAIVVVREDAPGDRRLVAYVVPKIEDGGWKIEDRLPDAAGMPSSILHPLSSILQELRSFLQAQLPGYMVPAAFVPLDALPLTPNGKVDRRRLPARGAIGPRSERTIVAPRTEVERGIAALWQEVLQLEQVGVDDNFFDLGGDSLLLTRVYDGIRAICGKEVSMTTLFRYPTISGLAGYATQNEDESQRLDQRERSQARAQKKIAALKSKGPSGRTEGVS